MKKIKLNCDFAVFIFISKLLYILLNFSSNYYVHYHSSKITKFFLNNRKLEFKIAF